MRIGSAAVLLDTPAPDRFKQDKTSANSPRGGGPSCLDVFPSITDEMFCESSVSTETLQVF